MTTGRINQIAFVEKGAKNPADRTTRAPTDRESPHALRQSFLNPPFAAGTERFDPL